MYSACALNPSMDKACAVDTNDVRWDKRDSLWLMYCVKGDTATAAKFIPELYVLIDKKDVYPQQKDTVMVLYKQRWGDRVYCKTIYGDRVVDDAIPLKSFIKR